MTLLQSLIIRQFSTYMSIYIYDNGFHVIALNEDSGLSLERCTFCSDTRVTHAIGDYERITYEEER